MELAIGIRNTFKIILIIKKAERGEGDDLEPIDKEGMPRESYHGNFQLN